MQRSMTALRMDGEPAPYHIQYRIDDLASMRAVARLGGIVDDLADRSRTLEVQVRVGDYMFDSSRFVTQDRGGGVVHSQSELPASLDDNYDAIRRQIWLTTDAAYKRAVSIFAKKKATFQNRAEAADVLPDFSRETPVTTLQPGRPMSPSGSAWVDRVKQLSAVFASSTELDGSEVWLGRNARDNSLPEQRGIQDGHADRIGLPPGDRRSAGRRRVDGAGRVHRSSRAGSRICRRCRN